MIPERQKFTIDAEGKSYGRLATEVAGLLRGKSKVAFKKHVDVGDFVEIVNLDKIKFSGNKLNTTIKHRHTGYPGGLKSATLGTLFEKNPEKLFKNSVRGMLPKNKLTNNWLKRLTVKVTKEK